MQQDFWINGMASGQFGCRLLHSWTVQDEELETLFVQGRDSSSFLGWTKASGRKTLILPVHFFGESPQDALQKRSQMTQALLDRLVELQMPDGFLYRAVLTSTGTTKAVTLDGGIVATEYQLVGMQCQPLEQVQCEGTLFAKGTYPQMDCRITATVGQDATRYSMAGVTWWNVKKGDLLVMDGIDKLILKNGKNAVMENDATQWIKLQPGQNQLQCPDPLLVEYYPTYL